MTTTATPSRVEGEDVVALRAPTLAWALKRTLIGITILTVSVTCAAWLLYASIDPTVEAAPAARSQPPAGQPISTGTIKP